jgi:uncharacterized protein (TIGR03437 family)
MKYIPIIMGLTFAALAQQHSAFPVVLVDGVDFTGQACLGPTDASKNFGGLAHSLWADSGHPQGTLAGGYSLYFSYCNQLHGGIVDTSLDDLADKFGEYLRTGPLQSGKFDIVAYDIGGLIVRRYLSRKQALEPDAYPSIHKLVLIGTPNFGVMSLLKTSPTLAKFFFDALFPGSQFLWELNTWNQNGDDLRGTDTIAIAGSQDRASHQTFPGPYDASDGVVLVSSASLDFTPFPDRYQRTRVLLSYYQSTHNTLTTSPDTYAIIRSFLDGTDAWKTVGISPIEASRTGGLLWRVFDEIDGTAAVTGTPTVTAPGLSFALTTTTNGAWGWYQEYCTEPAVSPATINFTAAGKNQTDDVFIQPGAYEVLISKSGPGTQAPPSINRYGIRPAASSPLGASPSGALSVAPDSLISIYGKNLASSTASAAYPWPTSLGSTRVSLNGVEGVIDCPISYASPNQINAYIPAVNSTSHVSIRPGQHYLYVTNPCGYEAISFMIEAVAPALFALAGNSAAALHSNYQVVSTSNPAAPQETLSLYGTGAGSPNAAGVYRWASGQGDLRGPRTGLPGPGPD